MPDIDLVDWSVEEFRRLLDQPLDASDAAASQAARQMIMGDRSLSATATSTAVTRGTVDAGALASTQETPVDNPAPGSQSTPASSDDVRPQMRSDPTGWQTSRPRPDVDRDSDGAATPEIYALNAVRRFARRAVGALRSEGLDAIAESNQPHVNPNEEQQSPQQTPSDTAQLATISSLATNTPPPPGTVGDYERSIRKAILVLDVQVTSFDPKEGAEPNPSGAPKSILGQAKNSLQLTPSRSEDAAQATPSSAPAEPSAPEAGTDRDAAAIFDDSTPVASIGSECETDHGGIQPHPLDVSQAELMAVTQTSEPTDAGEPEALNSGGFGASDAASRSLTIASTASQPLPNQDSTEGTLEDVDAQQMTAPLGRDAPYGLSRTLSETDLSQPDPNQSGFGQESNEDREPEPDLPDGVLPATVASRPGDEVVDRAHDEPIDENVLFATGDMTKLVAVRAELPPTEPTDQDLASAATPQADLYLLPAPAPEQSVVETRTPLESSSNEEDLSATAHQALQTAPASQTVEATGESPVLSIPAPSSQAAAGSATRELAVEPGRLELLQAQPILALPAASPQLLLKNAVIRPDVSTALAYRERAIILRWALRDIRGMRLKMSPVDPDTLQTLVDLSLVEMASGSPVLTLEGRAAIA